MARRGSAPLDSIVALGVSLGLALACGGRSSVGEMDSSFVPPFMPGRPIEGIIPPPELQPPQLSPPPGVVTPPVGIGGPPMGGSSCADGVRGGNETDTDCGGPDCGPCGPASSCQADRDCRGGGCDFSGICRDLSCFDGVKNGSEAEADCGGECLACPPRLDDCPCASSAGLMPLGCGGQTGGRAHATSDTILFSLCEGNPTPGGVPGRCDLARWTLASGSQVLIGDAEPRGLSADGQTMLAQSAVPALFSSRSATGLPLLSAVALSPDAHLVLGTIEGTPLPVAALWTTATGVEPIELPLPDNAAGLEPMAMSADGSVIAGVTVDSQSRPLDVFRWTEAGGLVTIVPAYFEDDSSRSGLSLSDDGSTLVGTMDFDPSPTVKYAVAFLWSDTSGAYPIYVPAPEPSQLGLVRGLSSDGWLVLGTSLALGPFLYADVNQVTRLEQVLQAAGVPLDGWILNGALALSPDRRVVVGDGYCGGLPAIYRAVIGD